VVNGIATLVPVAGLRARAAKKRKKLKRHGFNEIDGQRTHRRHFGGIAVATRQYCKSIGDQAKEEGN
jgi:hypothetical protein